MVSVETECATPGTKENKQISDVKGTKGRPHLIVEKLEGGVNNDEVEQRQVLNECMACCAISQRKDKLVARSKLLPARPSLLQSLLVILHKVCVVAVVLRPCCGLDSEVSRLYFFVDKD